MKRILLLLLLILFAGNLLQAQDIILKLTGDELEAKVTEITLNDIVYKHPDSLQGRTYTIPKKEVFMIKYANGTKEVITRIEPESNTFAGLSSKEMYERGRADAKKYYKGSGAMWGTAAATLFIGLPAPVVIGAIPPKINYQEVSEVSLLQNPHYTRGYKQQAHHRKIRKVAAGAGIGAGIGLALLYIVISAMPY